MQGRRSRPENLVRVSADGPVRQKEPFLDHFMVRPTTTTLAICSFSSQIADLNYRRHVLIICEQVAIW
jgi:hypothetical protein